MRTEGPRARVLHELGKVAGDLTDPVLGAAHIVPGLAWVLGR
jgi:hypothetical protein